MVKNSQDDFCLLILYPHQNGQQICQSFKSVNTLQQARHTFHLAEKWSTYAKILQLFAFLLLLTLTLSFCSVGVKYGD